MMESKNDNKINRMTTTSIPFLRIHTTLKHNKIQEIKNSVPMSYHKSSQRVVVTRHNELWQVVEESYGKSLQRLMVTLYAPFTNPLSRAFMKGTHRGQKPKER